MVLKTAESPWAYGNSSVIWSCIASRVVVSKMLFSTRDTMLTFFRLFELFRLSLNCNLSILVTTIYVKHHPLINASARKILGEFRSWYGTFCARSIYADSISAISELSVLILFAAIFWGRFYVFRSILFFLLARLRNYFHSLAVFSCHAALFRRVQWEGATQKEISIWITYHFVYL